MKEEIIIDEVESVIGLEAIYKSERKCEKGVMRKGSVQAFSMNRLKNCILLSDALIDGTYKPKPTRPVKITYPKPRVAYANAFPDRVYQRSLNDNVVYPTMSKQFVKENMACQKGKGTDKARRLLRKKLHDAWIHYGTDFYILEIDIRKYYENMLHNYTDEVFRKKLSAEMYRRVRTVLHEQYSGDKGYHPGSQLVQIAGISYPNKIDHTVKERYRPDAFIRYMDDIRIISQSKDTLEDIIVQTSKEFAEIGLSLHPDKTRIVTPIDGTMFLGFLYQVRENGRVTMLCDPKKIKANRVKLYRLVSQVAKNDLLTVEDCDNSIECMLAHMAIGNNYHSAKRLNEYYNKLITGVSV